MGLDKQLTKYYLITYIILIYNKVQIQ